MLDRMHTSLVSVAICLVLFGFVAAGINLLMALALIVSAATLGLIVLLIDVIEHYDTPLHNTK